MNGKIFFMMMRQANDIFIDIYDKMEEMDFTAAKELYNNMMFKRIGTNNIEKKIDLTDDFIVEFKNKTNLSIRKIAEITGLNKDKINKVLRT